MPLRSVANLEEDIRRVIRKLPAEMKRYTLKCSIDGTASGISSAFISALVRVDQSGQASEGLHILIAELGRAVADSTASQVQRVDICIAGEKVSFSYPSV